MSRERGMSVFEVIPVGGAFGLAKRGTVTKTPKGRRLVHPSRPLLVAVAAKTAKDDLDLRSLTLYSMLCTLKDFVEPERKRAPSCRRLLLDEWSLRRCAGPEVTAQLARLECLETYFNRHGLPMFMLSQAGGWKHQEKMLVHAGLAGELDQVVAFFDRELTDIGPERHCVVTHGVHRHGVFILALILAQGHCSPEEYAEAVAAVRCVIPDVFEISKRDAKGFVRNVAAEARLMLRFSKLAAVHPSR